MVDHPWYHLETQEQWKAYLQQLLRSNDRALYRACVAIYRRQTAAEQLQGKAIEDDGKGFTKYDAPVLSRIAVDLLHGRPLSQRDYDTLRRAMPKYWRQLMVISQSKMQAQAQAEQPHRQEQPPQPQACPCEYGICGECEAQMRFEI